MGLRKFIKSLPKVDNVDKKIPTWGFVVFTILMIIIIISIVVLLSIY